MLLPPNLTELDIFGNQIETLASPKGVFLLPPNLTKLIISYNQITSLPLEMVRLRNLREFGYSEIRIKTIHPSVKRFLKNIIVF